MPRMNLSVRLARSLLACTVGAAVLAGCDPDPVVSPMRQGGSFELTSRNGQRIPAPVNLPLGTDGGMVMITWIDGGTLELGSLNVYKLTLAVRIEDAPHSVVLGEGLATYTPSAVVLTLAGGRSVTGTYGRAEPEQTLTLPLGAPWGTLLFTRGNSLVP